MFQISSLIIYLTISFYITVFVGYKCYKIGSIFLINFIENEQICHSINQLLLVGYYLLNLGYIAISVNSWPQIENWSHLFYTVSIKLSNILFILCFLHFVNILTIYISRKKQKINL